MIMFLIALAIVLAGGVAAALFRRSGVADVLYDWLVGAGCALAAGAAVHVLADGRTYDVTLPASTPGGAWVLGLDALSAMLVLAIAIVGGASAIYGTRYVRPEREHRATWVGQSLFVLLLVSMFLVVTARAIIPFLVSWEAMAITSYLALVAEHERADVRRAGMIYLVATHAGTLALFAMFASWAQLGNAPDWTFASLAHVAPALPYRGALVLLLATAGFGFKAGLVPLHFWLPPAHSAAPTPVSAVLSGVVIKLGIYGMLRVLLLLGGAPAWWGWLVLAIGAVTGVLGVLWALAQHDVKRLLAYHSVENIGIILIGIGVGAMGSAYGMPIVALLGYAGAVLHTLNHALFKGLLFLGAGAVYRATGSRDIEELGGLAKAMPLTWISFAIGSAAIIGVPPLNGFVSEWLVYQGLFHASFASATLRLAIAGVPALALIGALALACFAKVSGVIFLGSGRSDHATHAREVGAAMTAPMLLLAAACVLLGLVPSLGVIPAARAGAAIAGTADMTGIAPVLDSARTVGLLALGVLALSGAIWLMRRLLARRSVVRTAPTWGCGYALPTPRMQYTASSFAAPLVSLFGRMSGVRVERTATSLRTVAHDLVLDRVVLPLWGAVHRGAVRLRPMQQGRLYMYLLYVLAALVAMLTYVAVGARPS